MKFFYKMFLGMTVILAVALGMIECVTLSYSLEHAVKREQDSALSQHQMIKYSIETVILNMKSEDVDKELTDMMSQSAKSIVGDEGGMYLADDDGKRDKRETGRKAQRKGSKKSPDSRQHSACAEK